MYAELTIIAHFDRDELTEKLIKLIGPNLATGEDSVKGTIFEGAYAAIQNKLIAVEVINISASVIYFYVGDDTLSIHVTAVDVAQLKAQATRLVRQLRRLFKSRQCAATASVFTREPTGPDKLIFSGEYLTKRKRLWRNLADKWLGKLLTPGITFFLTLTWVTTAPAIQSAQIALLAAAASFLVEGVSLVPSSEEWTWKDPT